MPRKRITFDIDTKVVEKIFGKNISKPYRDIEQFLLKNNFEHIQGSVYDTSERVTSLIVHRKISKMLRQYPYLEKCIRDIRQATIYNELDLNDLLSYDGTPGKYAKYPEADAKPKEESPEKEGQPGKPKNEIPIYPEEDELEDEPEHNIHI